MPLNSRSQIVGGGANLQPPTSVGSIPQIVDVGPPGALSDTEMRQWLDGAVPVITIGATDVRPGIGATETLRLSQGFISQGVGQDTFIAGRGAAAGGTDSIAIGRGATGTPSNIVVIGANARASSNTLGTNVVVIGANALVALSAGADSVLIGADSDITAGGAQAVVIGYQASSNVSGGIAIGNAAGANPPNVNRARCIVIGANSFAQHTCIVIGSNSSATGTGTSIAQPNHIIIGHGTATGTSSVAGQGNTIIGSNCQTGNEAYNNILIGNLTTVSANQQNVIIIGSGSTSTVSNAIIIGRGINNTVANRGYFGAPFTQITEVVIGAGDSAASVPARVVRFTNGAGTDVAAGDVQWLAPLGTGNATVAGHDFRGGEAVGSGGAQHTNVSLVRIYSGGTQVAIINARRDELRILPTTIGELRNPANTNHVLRWGADTLGFFGAGAVARPSVPLGSTTDQVITALQLLGLFGP